MTDYRKVACGHVGPWPGDPHTCIESGTVENPGIGVNCPGFTYTPAPEVGALVEAAKFAQESLRTVPNIESLDMGQERHIDEAFTEISTALANLKETP